MNFSKLWERVKDREAWRAAVHGVSRSVMSDSSPTPWTVAHQAPLSMGFPRQEYWSGLPFPSPGDLTHPGIEPGFPAQQADSLPSEPPENPLDSQPLERCQPLAGTPGVFVDQMK